MNFLLLNQKHNKNWLARLLVKIEMSQVDFAWNIGMSYMMINHYIAGRRWPTPNVAKRIINLAQAHGVNLTMEEIYEDIDMNENMYGEGRVK